MTEDEIRALPYRPCVGLAISNRRGGLWAGQRLDSSFDAWQMPQGGIDPGETPLQAALRELTEETSIPSHAVTVAGEIDDWLPYDLPFDLVPKLWKGRFRGQKQKWFLLHFDGTDDLVDIATADPEFSRWAWMTPRTLLSSIVPFKQDTYARVLGEFGPALEV